MLIDDDVANREIPVQVDRQLRRGIEWTVDEVGPCDVRFTESITKKVGVHRSADILAHRAPSMRGFVITPRIVAEIRMCSMPGHFAESPALNSSLAASPTGRELNATRQTSPKIRG
ncbi:MAG: hypothetical protein RO009_24060 [Pseudorhodoplanes sp.]|jgi:hypothetical protein|nr:hypothetical protein [Pseudorhodoplanes sp.]